MSNLMVSVLTNIGCCLTAMLATVVVAFPPGARYGVAHFVACAGLMTGVVITRSPGNRRGLQVLTGILGCAFTACVLGYFFTSLAPQLGEIGRKGIVLDTATLQAELAAGLAVICWGLFWMFDQMGFDPKLTGERLKKGVRVSTWCILSAAVITSFGIWAQVFPGWHDTSWLSWLLLGAAGVTGFLASVSVQLRRKS